MYQGERRVKVYARRIKTYPTISRRGENGDHPAVLLHLEACLPNLMSPHKVTEAVVSEKPLQSLCRKNMSGPSRLIIAKSVFLGPISIRRRLAHILKVSAQGIFTR